MHIHAAVLGSGFDGHIGKGLPFAHQIAEAGGAEAVVALGQLLEVVAR